VHRWSQINKVLLLKSTQKQKKRNMIFFAILFGECLLIIMLSFALLYTIRINSKQHKRLAVCQIPGMVNYRLGDMVAGYGIFDQLGYACHKRDFPNSIAVEYMDTTEKRNDLDILSKIISRRNPQQLPTEQTLMMHIRTGDVIDSEPYSVDEFLKSAQQNINGGWYVKPVAYYKSILEQIAQVKEIEKIVIISGFHTSGDHSKSLEYIKRIEHLFIAHGYVVETRINKKADDDFLYMTQSKYFVQSGGEFSKLIANMVRKNGGNVFQG
jgi:hypothetical protein